jgi:HD-like signal output (HDOD) protein
VGRSSILVITERDHIVELFQRAAGESHGILFARHRSAILRHIHSVQMATVIADNRVSLSLGSDILRWLHADHPWLHFVLLVDSAAEESAEDGQVRRFAQLVPVPESVEAAKELLIRFLHRDGEESSAEKELSEELDVADAADDADLVIVSSITELVDQLPALPIVVQKMLALLQREDASTREISKIISLDPAVSMRVLRIANSALYALPNPVTTIQHAVNLLGFAELRRLSVGLKVTDLFSDASSCAIDRNAFWEHSLACGVCARRIAERTRSIEPDEAFLGGLLHDIGKLVLGCYFHEEWGRLQERALAEAEDPLKSEEMAVGMPHTVIGKMLLAHWQIPDLHQNAIEFHHGIPPEKVLSAQERTYCAIISTANILVRWMDLGSSGHSTVRQIPSEVWEPIQLNDEELEEVLRMTRWEVAEWKKVLGLGQKESLAALTETTDSWDSGGSPPVWVIGSRVEKVPSLTTLLSASGYPVRRAHWGEKLLGLVAEVPHQAIMMDLRRAKVDARKLIPFLLATRSRSVAPILVIVSNGLNLPPALESQKIHALHEAPHIGTLKQWLQESVG